MAGRTKAYVDTSAFIAFLDQSDSYHDLFSRVFSDPPSLVTTGLVVAEGHGWFLRRYSQPKAIQFLNFIEDLKVLHIHDIGERELKEATGLIRKFSDQPLTMADATGLALMKQERIKTCWSTDRHLGLTGAELIIHSN
jgi:predicted nucleic acid-binding protein